MSDLKILVVVSLAALCMALIAPVAVAALVGCAVLLGFEPSIIHAIVGVIATFAVFAVKVGRFVIKETK